jgi:predicted RecA/RadA family phage recombinase
MKNYLESGDTAVVPAPANVVSGQFIVVGALFGVCMNDALSTVDVVIKREGVFELPKETGGGLESSGDVLYWDAGNARFTKTAAANHGARRCACRRAERRHGRQRRRSRRSLRSSARSSPARRRSTDRTRRRSRPASRRSYSVELTLKKNAAPGLGTSILTYDTTGGTLNVYGWKPTAAGDCTLIASTGTETFSYVVRGS